MMRMGSEEFNNVERASERLDLFGFSRRLPMVYQNEVAECGLACLAMVAGFYGHLVDLRVLREKFSISLKGSTLKTISGIAIKLGFSIRAIKVEPQDLDKIKLPAILHWNMNHFVVIKRCTSKYITVHDPAIGNKKLSKCEVSKMFTGIALELYPSKKFEKKVVRKSIKLGGFISGIEGLKKSLFQIIILAFCLQFFGILTPYYTQLVIDNVLLENDKSFLYVVVFGAIGLAIISTVIRVARQWVSLYFNSTYTTQLSSSLFRHMMYLPLGWFESRQVGDMVSRFSSLNTIKNTLSSGIVSGTLNIVTALVTLLVMLAYSIKLTTIAVSGILVYTILRAIFFSPMKSATENMIIKKAEENSCFIESIKTMPPIKMMAKEDERGRFWVDKLVGSMNSGILLQKYKILFGVCQSSVQAIERVVMLWVGALLVMDTKFTLGMLIAFTAWKTQFVSSCYSLINGFFQFKFLSVHMDRMSDIALTETETELCTSVEIRKEFVKGSLKVESACFKYGSEEAWVFKDISFSVLPGECVAIVGASGCGKTTLIKAMMGLVGLSSGRVMLDGMDIKSIGVRAYRSSCAGVLQNDTLISGTIQDNISFYDTNVDMDFLRKCAESAAILKEVEAMPMGFNSIVGEMGSMLSGGQIQRVLIARALYQKPKILFLDEATSHLDSENESYINGRLSEMKITRIVIAHRKSSIDVADRVIDITNLQKQVEAKSDRGCVSNDDRVESAELI